MDETTVNLNNSEQNPADVPQTVPIEDEAEAPASTDDNDVFAIDNESAPADDTIYEQVPDFGGNDTKKKKKDKVKKDKKSDDDFEYEQVPELSFLSIKTESPFETAQKRQAKRITRQKYTIIALVCITIALIGFAIFINSHYKKLHETTVDNSVSRIVTLMNSAMKDDFDYATKYYEIVAELDVIRTTKFYTDESENNKKILNEIYSLSVKLPNQYKEYMSDICEGFTEIKEGNPDKGYLKLKTVIDRVDKLDIE